MPEREKPGSEKTGTSLPREGKRDVVVSALPDGAERRRKQQRIGRYVAIVAITLLMLSVPWVMFTAYTNLRGSVEALEEISRPDGDRLVVEEVRLLLVQAGNSVMRYALTQSEEDLISYGKAREDLNAVLLSLERPEPNPTLDSLQRLIKARYLVLDDWVKLASRNSTASLGSVQQMITEAQKLPADSLAALQSRRKKRSDLEEELNALNSVAQEQAEYFAAIEQRLDVARRKALSREDTRRRLTLELVQEDAEVSKAIQIWLDRMDRAAISRAEALAAASRVKSEQVNRMIFLYGILSTAMLLLLATGLIYLFRRGDRMEWALQRTLERERGLVRAREAFLANLSHELRTPLHAIGGFAQRLVDLRLPERASEYASIISDAASHLLGLVEHILDYARESSLQDAPRKEPLQVSVLLDEVLALIQPRTDTKAIHLEKEVGTQVPPWLEGDRLRLRQALLNLAGNAVKFTEQGHVRLRAAGQPMADEQFRLILEVEDSGPGISEADRERIFEPFRQGGEEKGAYREGLGLGLAITTDLIKRMGGTITLDSTLGKGSLFRIELPLPLCEAPEGSEAPDLDHEPYVQPDAPLNVQPDLRSGVPLNVQPNVQLNLQPRLQPELVSSPRPNESALPDLTALRQNIQHLRILAADDEAFNRKLLQAQLTGLQAEIVEDGLAALAAFERQPADVLLLDVRMPGLDGHEALRAIRALAPGVAAAAITAGVTEAEHQACRASGFDSLLAKPFSERSLLELIGRLAAADNGALRPEAPNQPSSNPLEEEEPGTLQLESLRTLAGEDRNFVPDMLKLFLERLEQTRADWEAALDAGDGKAVGAAAHKLAAPARQLGFEELADALRALEAEATAGASAEALANRCRRLQPMLHTTALRVAAEWEKTKMSG
ncbi:MAG: response regulator [Bacteroidetes bacterium]|nr:response regulator [Bacteroidota bacterium]